MALSALTKHHLRQSDDSLSSLTSISQCRDQVLPSSAREHAVPLNRLPSLKDNKDNINFTIGGSWLTKSESHRSSSSSIYSSLAEPTSRSNRQYPTTTMTSETSARSSIVSQSQQSAKSIDSSVGITSVSEDSHYSQKSAQKQKGRSEGLKQALNFSSLRKKEIVEKSPLKWLCRRSDANIRHSTSQFKNDLQIELEDRSHVFDIQAQSSKTICSDLGPVIVQRLERLEEKIDIIFSGSSSMKRSTMNSTDLELGHTMIEESSQNPCTNLQIDTDTRNHLKILTAKITHLSKSNKDLSSCIDALGSSGLIDLLEMLSCSLERLHTAIISLREEQKHRQQQKEISPDQANTGKQFESQLDLIHRLAFLLGQREEQFKHERQLNQSYRRNIEGLEEMICVLEEEWEKAMPVMAQADVHIGAVGEVLGKLSARGTCSD